CKAGTSFCDGQSLYSCSADGTSRTLLSACAAGTNCDADAGACQQQACTPKSRDCRDGKPAHCSDDGSAWVAEKAWAKDKACVAGDCNPVVCDPNQMFCGDDGNPRTCSSDGTTSKIWDTCLSGYSHCVSTTSVAYCTNNACTPSQPFCSYTGDVVVMC